MSVSTTETREWILEALASAADELAFATSSLGEAYERLDDATADRLEADLYRPAQKAYGRAKRTHAQFAERVGLSARSIASAAPAAGSRTPKDLIDIALTATEEADRGIAELQDDPLTLDAGDAELRAGLIEVRGLLGGLPGAARELVRRLGR